MQFFLQNDVNVIHILWFRIGADPDQPSAGRRWRVSALISVAIVLIFLQGLSMVVLCAWCIADTHRAQNNVGERILSYLLDGCGLAMGIIGIVLGCLLIASFLQYQ